MPKTTDVPPSMSLKYYDAGREIAIQFRLSARQRFAASLSSALILSGHVAFQIEPICKRERSGSLQAKS
jgi:hypothetical protein